MRTVTLTEEELSALRMEFFPRVTVASVVSMNLLAAKALYKLDPTALPWTTRDDIEKGRI